MEPIVNIYPSYRLVCHTCGHDEEYSFPEAADRARENHECEPTDLARVTGLVAQAVARMEARIARES